MITATNIHKSYGTLEVLKGIDLRIERGEIISIVGASGAGKSTLLHILGTLDRPDTGEILYDNVFVSRLNDKELSVFRNLKIGFVFQFHHLLPEFTALENVCIPSFIAGRKKNDSEERAIAILELMNLEERLHHKPSELSGGEQQRVAVARALVNEPTIVFADEPSGNLDSTASVELHKLFFSLREKLNQTFVIVTHNPELAAMSDRQIRLVDGKVI